MTTYLIFDTDETERAALTERIEQHLESALGYAVPVFLRTAAEVESTITLDPFAGVKVTPDTRLLVTFIPQPLPDIFALPLRSPSGDYEMLGATAGEVFSVLRIIGGRPADPVTYIERACKMRTTSRFYPTLVKLLAAAKGG